MIAAAQNRIKQIFHFLLNSLSTVNLIFNLDLAVRVASLGCAARILAADEVLGLLVHRRRLQTEGRGPRGSKAKREVEQRVLLRVLLRVRDRRRIVLLVPQTDVLPLLRLGFCQRLEIDAKVTAELLEVRHVVHLEVHLRIRIVHNFVAFKVRHCNVSRVLTSPISIAKKSILHHPTSRIAKHSIR